MANWWEPVDVTSWEEYLPETRGPRRPKVWTRSPEGALWLRKSPPPPRPDLPNTARRSEPAIEVFAIELARRVGIDTADTRPATWAAGERGVISRRFHGNDEDQHPGSELLQLPAESGSSPDAKRRRDEGRASATLGRVHAALIGLEQLLSVPLVAPFLRILAVDAWLGNGDRHSGNWAVITSRDSARLAPMYDPTACLGVELTDDRPILQTPTDDAIERYVARCPSGFGGGSADGRSGVPMREVLAELEAWPEWHDALRDLVPRFRTLTTEAPALLSEIPDDWLPPARKAFAARVLARRVTLFR